MKRRTIRISQIIIVFCWILLTGSMAFAQVDQGTITGVVQDNTGAVIPNAQVTLTNTDNGFVLQRKANGSGIYVFSPIKIGHYTVGAEASGFQTTVQKNLQLNIQGRLNVVLVLTPGAVSQTVTVSTAPPLLQTQSGSVGQVVSTRTINNTPLNGRNWVYIAQLTPGVVATPGSRGGDTGDFSANGQRPDQNNFVLDGVDNNVDIADYQNGSSYNVRPPPDALAEFKVQTSDYSAEFGHSVGAILNASIKSGTNQIHGDFWEYFRNTALAAKNWNAPTNPPYHENQFGATLGFPILRNKLFYFGDAEANRITYASTNTLTVPTPLMRQGNFSELLNTGLTGDAKMVQLYQPNSGGTAKLSCNGQNNVFCPNQINSVAQNLLNLFPLPNTNNGKTYNNFVENLPDNSNTWQWDQRVDWNPTAKDQAYARYSYQHVQLTNTAPLGLILDGTSNYDGVSQNFLSENGMASETHIFNPNLVNEFRFAYNWGSFSNLQENYDEDLALKYGLGGIPFGPGFPDNGGLPSFTVTGINSFGTHGFDPSIKKQNIYQILDNVTAILGNHSLKFGVDFQSLRSSALSPPTSRGSYTFSGEYTSDLNGAFTGFGPADFLANQINTASIGNETTENFTRWYRAAYVQDDWRVNTRFTLNLGLRYDYYQPQKEMAGNQANFIVTSSGIGTGTGVFQRTPQSQNTPLSPALLALFAKQNISVQYLKNQYLVSAQKTNFAPRLGFAYQVDPTTVLHGGFGIFYGGLEPYGGENLGENQPYFLTATFPTGSCAPNNCPSDGLTLEQGFSQALAVGLANFVSSPTLSGTDPAIKTPYTIGYNLTAQHALSNNLVASMAYVGNFSRHLPTTATPNAANALQNPANAAQHVEPFPNMGADTLVTYEGTSTYNSLQTKLEKRYANGLEFLAAYTWSHTMDDSGDPLNGGVGDRNTNLIPIVDEYTNSAQDIRNRFTFNSYYNLPFGAGRAYLNHTGWVNQIVGGWAANLTFIAQSGQPFTVTPNNTAATGGTRRANVVRDPLAPGGSPDPSNSTIVCPAQVRNSLNWYNPCAFANPQPGSNIARTGTTPAETQVTGTANAIAYLGGKANQVYGPGYERIDMSLFKNFATWRSQYLQFRADIFNVLNHPTLANPSSLGINSSGGQITGPKDFQANTPDARFFQLSAKYVF